MDETNYVMDLPRTSVDWLCRLAFQFQETEDLKILGEPDLCEPMAPVSFDERALAAEIRTTFEQCRRLPGEAFIHPILRVASASDENMTKLAGHTVANDDDDGFLAIGRR